jgi:hypothetical protein
MALHAACRAKRQAKPLPFSRFKELNHTRVAIQRVYQFPSSSFAQQSAVSLALRAQSEFQGAIVEVGSLRRLSPCATGKAAPETCGHRLRGPWSSIVREYLARPPVYFIFFCAADVYAAAES